MRFLRVPLSIRAFLFSKVNNSGAKARCPATGRTWAIVGSSSKAGSAVGSAPWQFFLNCRRCHALRGIGFC